MLHVTADQPDRGWEQGLFLSSLPFSGPSSFPEQYLRYTWGHPGKQCGQENILYTKIIEEFRGVPLLSLLELHEQSNLPP